MNMIDWKHINNYIDNAKSILLTMHENPDGDGLGNNADLDDDGDGFSDVIEIQSETDPLNIKEYPIDTDNDGIINLLDPDDDNDGFSDELEDEVGSSLINL